MRCRFPPRNSLSTLSVIANALTRSTRPVWSALEQDGASVCRTDEQRRQWDQRRGGQNKVIKSFPHSQRTQLDSTEGCTPAGVPWGPSVTPTRVFREERCKWQRVSPTSSAVGECALHRIGSQPSQMTKSSDVFSSPVQRRDLNE